MRTIRNRHKANTLMNLKQKRERCNIRMLHCSVKVYAWLEERRDAPTREDGQQPPVLRLVRRGGGACKSTGTNRAHICLCRK